MSFDRAPIVFPALGHAGVAGIAVRRFFYAVQQRVDLRDVGAGVHVTVCTSPVSASTPMCAFMPKYLWLP